MAKRLFKLRKSPAQQQKYVRSVRYLPLTIIEVRYDASLKQTLQGISWQNVFFKHMLESVLTFPEI